MTTLNVGFKGYLSLWKIFWFALFWIVGLGVLAFGNIDDFTNYKWLFSPLAMPLRILIGALGFYFLFGLLRLLFTSLSGKPVIYLKDDVVTIRYGKYGQFRISDIDEVGTIFNGDYFLRSTGRKYGLSLVLCKNASQLRSDMEGLREYVSAGQK